MRPLPVKDQRRIAEWLASDGRFLAEKHILAVLADTELKMSDQLLTAVAGEYPNMVENAQALRREAIVLRNYLSTVSAMANAPEDFKEAVISVVPNIPNVHPS